MIQKVATDPVIKDSEPGLELCYLACGTTIDLELNGVGRVN